MCSTVVKRGGVVEPAMSVTDCSLSAELDFAVDRGCAGGIVGEDRRGVGVRCCG